MQRVIQVYDNSDETVNVHIVTQRGTVTFYSIPRNGSQMSRRQLIDFLVMVEIDPTVQNARCVAQKMKRMPREILVASYNQVLNRGTHCPA